MEMTITTPSLLFPAISLLLLAYTNRFVVLTNVIRQLSNTKEDNAAVQVLVRRQMDNLRLRIEVNISTEAINIELEKFDALVGSSEVRPANEKPLV